MTRTNPDLTRTNPDKSPGSGSRSDPDTDMVSPFRGNLSSPGLRPPDNGSRVQVDAQGLELSGLRIVVGRATRWA